MPRRGVRAGCVPRSACTSWTPPTPTAQPSARRDGRAGTIDWKLVAAFRSQASEQLTKALGEDRVSTDRAAQEALGRSIILELLGGGGRGRGDRRAAVVDAGRAGRVGDQAVFNALFRMGRLQPLIEDDRVENIIITGYDRVWLELLDGTLIEGPPVADSDQELIDFLAFLASRSEVSARPFSEAQPKLHLRLDDGSRLAATAWVTPRPSVVIRRHRLTQVSLDDLVGRGSLSPIAASFLRAAVKGRLSIVVCGAQGFGKTTMARALCGEFGRTEAIATLETEYELGLHELPDRHAIVHAWEARTGSGERGPDGRMAGEFAHQRGLVRLVPVQREPPDRRRDPRRGGVADDQGDGVRVGVAFRRRTRANARAAMRKLITCAMEAGPQITHELATLKLAETIDLIVQLDMDSVEHPDGSVSRTPVGVGDRGDHHR